jgi:hypothetical protein
MNMLLSYAGRQAGEYWQQRHSPMGLNLLACREEPILDRYT